MKSFNWFLKHYLLSLFIIAFSFLVVLLGVSTGRIASENEVFLFALIILFVVFLFALRFKSKFEFTGKSLLKNKDKDKYNE